MIPGDFINGTATVDGVTFEVANGCASVASINWGAFEHALFYEMDVEDVPPLLLLLRSTFRLKLPIGELPKPLTDALEELMGDLAVERVAEGVA